ncbi:MAG: hypothetical protein Q4G63_04225 [Bacteroidia bacterium]|nr:hypothetical protein [Bacteroidia bacterium]
MKLFATYKYFAPIVLHIVDESKSKHSICGCSFAGNFDYSYITIDGDYNGTVKEFTDAEAFSLENLCKRCKTIHQNKLKEL